MDSKVFSPQYIQTTKLIIKTFKHLNILSWLTYNISGWLRLDNKNKQKNSHGKPIAPALPYKVTSYTNQTQIYYSIRKLLQKEIESYFRFQYKMKWAAHWPIQ